RIEDAEARPSTGTWPHSPFGSDPTPDVGRPRAGIDYPGRFRTRSDERMTRVLAYQHGIYPRSEGVVAATRDLERGRTTDDAVAEAFGQDEAAFVEVQRKAGLDLF